MNSATEAAELGSAILRILADADTVNPGSGRRRDFIKRELLGTRRHVADGALAKALLALVLARLIEADKKNGVAVYRLARPSHVLDSETLKDPATRALALSVAGEALVDALLASPEARGIYTEGVAGNRGSLEIGPGPKCPSDRRALLNRGGHS